MNKKRMVSILVIIILCGTLIAGIRFHIFDNMFKVERVHENDFEKPSQSIFQKEVHTNASDIRNKKELDIKYIHKMNQEVFFKSYDDTGLNINVMDARLTRDISSYRIHLDDFYLYGEAPSYADENGIFKKGYYYMVLRVKITNVDNQRGLLLMPGMFSYWFMNGKITEPSDMSGEVNFMTKIEGKDNVDSRNHLNLNVGESCVYDIITILDEHRMNEEIAKGKQCYLITNDSYLKFIPDDGDKVRFVKLDFRVEE